MFDLDGLASAVTQHGRVARIVLTDIAGSSPREVGAAMLVWPTGTTGTIGGGALEYLAMQAARCALAAPDLAPDTYGQHALGPDLGQCCGGRIGLLTEYYDAEKLSAQSVHLGPDWVARPLPNHGAAQIPKPFALRALEAEARRGAPPLTSRLVGGYFFEPIARPRHPLWIWGAGHVGRALVGVLHPLGQFDITWADTHEARFDDAPSGPNRLWDNQIAKFSAYAPASCDHVILTYSHQLDLEICHQLLLKGNFRSVSLIGSATKWARFRARLTSLGHAAREIDKIRCPIGDPSLGKHPQAIAIGVAADLLRRNSLSETEITDDDRDTRAVAHRGRDEGLSGGGRK